MTRQKGTDLRRLGGVLASDTRRRLWASIVSASDGPNPGLSLAALTSRERRDVQVLEEAGLVAVDGEIAVEVPTAFRDAVGSTGALEVGPERFFTRGVLEALPRRQGDRAQVLGHVAGRLFSGSPDHLTETELMDQLRVLARDPVGVRRELIDRGFVGRERDGSRYWLRETQAGG